MRAGWGRWGSGGGAGDWSRLFLETWYLLVLSLFFSLISHLLIHWCFSIFFFHFLLLINSFLCCLFYCFIISLLFPYFLPFITPPSSLFLHILSIICLLLYFCLFLFAFNLPTPILLFPHLLLLSIPSALSLFPFIYPRLFFITYLCLSGLHLSNIIP